ncbi:cytochrome P450 [Bombardia bombarda]|uniref:Cytochrome P450 n=1 Tax=Bombardia bombarda TaxID=252184 RepID=A0AA40CBA4_9PEZI|nr:cytochrome P450 [Bombardia bombarda]
MGSSTWILGLSCPSLSWPVVGSIVVFAAYTVWWHLHSPLRRYPGPFLAKFTNFWRMYHVTRGSFHNDLERLHHKYGPVVRIGPNILDVDYDPELIKTVFNTKGDWKKTEYYLASSALVDGNIVYNLFSEIDAAKHAQEKKHVAKYYSPNGVASFEPHIDKTIVHFCNELEKRFMNHLNESAKPTINMGEWITFYTWDVVGAITFSKPLGYLSAGHDFDGTLSNAEKAVDYFAWVGTMPFLDHVFDKNRFYKPIGPPGFGRVTGISIQHLIDRYQGIDKAYHDPALPDFLDRFIEAKQQAAAAAKAEHGDSPAVTDNQIVGWLMINMIAGADTTAIVLRSAIYYCLKNPRVWTRLRAELAAAGLTEEHTPLSYKATRAIPYLEAIVREALRILPGVSLSLERYVPAGEYRLPDGSNAPPGAILGFNPYVLCRNKEVWGDDAQEFVPERWLRREGESEEGYKERLQVMKGADLSFGAGSRICLGRHVGLMQVYKVMGTLAVRYELELADKEKEWKVINSWFPRQEGVEVRMWRRGGEGV